MTLTPPPTATPSRRSYAPLSDHDLERLYDLAMQRHGELRIERPDWCSQLLASCLVQGAARHRVHGDRGVKDIDVYLFYALPDGARANAFPFLRVTEHRDFGPSEHGIASYAETELADPGLARRIRQWRKFKGRRVDLLARAIPPDPSGPGAAVSSWLFTGRQKPDSTPWHLARCPVVSLSPDLGSIWWDGPATDEDGIEKGAYSYDK